MPYPDDFSTTAFDRHWKPDAPPPFDRTIALGPELLSVEQMIKHAIGTLDEQFPRIARTDAETARELHELREMLSAALTDHFEGGVVAIAERRHQDRHT